MKPSKKDIEVRAFEIYESRLQYNVPGDATTDWLLAEQDLTDDPEYWKSLEEEWR